MTVRIRHIVWSGTLLAWFLLAESSLEAQFTRDDWNQANEATVRLSPSAFPNLPAGVRTELEHRGCTVPQPWSERVQNVNVISGEFTSAGQKEWVVLCSRQRRSAILVFHAGASSEIEELAEQPDVQYLQVISGAGKIGYSRHLATATPSEIRRHFIDKKHFPRNINHDGVKDTFIEKASVVWYHSGNKWMRLSGAD
jgi:hypothetical protein